MASARATRFAPLACVVLLAVGGCGGARSAPAAAVPAASASATAPVTPPAPRGEVVIGERLGLRSEILGEDRSVLVYSPPPGGAITRFPVVYLLDGDAHFHHTTGLVDFLSSQGMMPRVIVVGVGNTDRGRDFTPTADAQLPGSGGADKFIAFLERELIPAVEAKYVTARYRVLVGHSFGGLLAIHALNQKPELFDAYVSLSPSLWWGEGKMQRETETLLASHPALDRVLYFTVGDEPDNMTGSNRAYAEMLRGKAPKSFRWRFEEMKYEDHGTIVHRGIHRGLEQVFAGWRPPRGLDSMAALERHYAGLSARFRIAIPMPEGMLNQLGYRLLAARKTDQALAAFRRNVELYPDSANVHDSLAEALESKGDVAGALRSYEMAVKTAARNRDPMLEAFKARLDKARLKSTK
jgi:uncharacterized protein